MKEKLFKELLEGVRQGGKYLRGRGAASRTFEIEVPDVRAIREHHGLSQPQFARLIGISPATLRNWEQGRRKPEGPARVLLRVAAQDIGVVYRALHPRRVSSRARR